MSRRTMLLVGCVGVLLLALIAVGVWRDVRDLRWSEHVSRDPGLGADAEKEQPCWHGYRDTIAVAATVGVDYPRLVDRCVRREREAMHTLFWLTEAAGFDAASAEGHSDVLSVLLRRLGDEFFAECLAREEAPVRQRVREQLLYEQGYGEDEHVTLEYIKYLYPATFPKDFTVD